MNKNNANIGFEKQIWNAACVLWGHIPASEYRQIIIGFILVISDSVETYLLYICILGMYVVYIIKYTGYAYTGRKIISNFEEYQIKCHNNIKKRFKWAFFCQLLVLNRHFSN